MAAVSEKSLVVLNYLKEVDGVKKVTAADIAEDLGLEKSSVNGTVTSGLARKGLVERVPAQVLMTVDGTEKYVDVKFIQLTDAGKKYDHEAALAQDAAASAKTDAE